MGLAFTFGGVRVQQQFIMLVSVWRLTRRCMAGSVDRQFAGKKLVKGS